MSNKIIQRISEQCGVPNILEVLSTRIPLSDLQSLLLEVYRKRVHELSPKDLMTQYLNNRFTKPAAIKPEQFWKFDELVQKSLPAQFEMMTLSPLAPLGTNSVVAPVDQNNIITTIRNTEVCSDNTNVLALECAVRRRKMLQKERGSRQWVNLCASQRVVRSQPFEHESVAFAHFQLLGLCTAGRDSGAFSFELKSLKHHLEFYLKLMKKTSIEGYSCSKIRVTLSAFTESHLVVLKELQEMFISAHDNVTFEMDQRRQSGRGYYTDAAFQIWVSNKKNHEYFIVDGGFTDWTQKLLTDRKERLLISGMGSERFIYCFAPNERGL